MSSTLAPQFSAPLLWKEVRAKKRREKLLWQEVADQSGCSFGVLTVGAQLGRTPSPEQLRPLLGWLGLPLERFLVTQRTKQKACVMCRALFIPRCRTAKYCTAECSEKSYEARHPKNRFAENIAAAVAELGDLTPEVSVGDAFADLDLNGGQ